MHISDLGPLVGNSFEFLGKSGRNFGPRAHISATGRKLKKNRFDHHFKGFLEHIVNLGLI